MSEAAKAPRKSRAKKAVATAAAPAIISIKGFDNNLACRGYQFEVGKTYEHDGDVKACKSGFHACTVEAHPLSVFAYYPPAGSRYALVAQAGATNSDDSVKIASAKITIDVEIAIGDLVKRAWDYVWSRATKEQGSHATGVRGAASATGYQGAASATGDQGAASATGVRGAASATGVRGAASANNGSAAMTNGYGGRVRGDSPDCPLFAVERESEYPYALLGAAHGITGRDGIEIGVWYECRAGKLVRA